VFIKNVRNQNIKILRVTPLNYFTLRGGRSSIESLTQRTQGAEMKEGQKIFISWKQGEERVSLEFFSAKDFYVHFFPFEGPNVRKFNLLEHEVCHNALYKLFVDATKDGVETYHLESFFFIAEQFISLPKSFCYCVKQNSLQDPK
jgi:hypothetical protein